jgi:hypothetical protein
MPDDDSQDRHPAIFYCHVAAQPLSAVVRLILHSSQCGFCRRTSMRPSRCTLESVCRPCHKTTMCDNKPYRDAKKKAREPMSFHADGSRIRILAIGYLAKVIRRLHVLLSPRFDHFALVSGFFKPKAVRPVELAPAAPNRRLLGTLGARDVQRFSFNSPIRTNEIFRTQCSMRRDRKREAQFPPSEQTSPPAFCPLQRRAGLPTFGCRHDQPSLIAPWLPAGLRWRHLASHAFLEMHSKQKFPHR